MSFHRRPPKRVFGLSLAEVTLLLVFLLLALLATSVSQDADLQQGKKELARLCKFQKEVDEVLGALGVSFKELRKLASRLVSADLVEQSKLDLAKLIDRLLAEKKRLGDRVSELEKNLHDLSIQTQRAETELRKLASRLVSADLVEQSKLDLAKLIDRLLAEKKRLGDRVSDLEKNLHDLSVQTQRAETELARLVKVKAAGEGGTEPGSCWLDAQGHVQYFLHITIYDHGIQIQSAWPRTRYSDLQAVGVNPDEVPSGNIRNAEFSRFARPIYLRTVDQGCRLFARLVDRTRSKDSYKRQCKFVERYFFVQEVNR